MADIELGRFSVNSYRGLPDALPFSVIEGELPAIISAPHAVSQLREGRVKPSDDFTGAMALTVAELSGASAIVASRYDDCDPNWDPFKTCAYKQALVRNYEWYVAHLDEFRGKSGVSHRVPWKQGILGLAKHFF